MMTTIQTTLIKTNVSGVGQVGPRKDRTALLISLVDGGAFKLCMGTTPDATSGIFVPTGMGYIELARANWGSGLDGSFTVISASGAADTIVVSEACHAP